ncbi:MAG: CD1871A family CXXC motif-containing protein [Anaerovoracaceae bacterium]
MRKLIKRQRITVLLLTVGILFFLYGIHRQEHVTVEKKSNIICLECIGIG